MSISENIQTLRSSRHVEFSAISGYNYYHLPETQQPSELVHALHAQADAMVYLTPAATSEHFFPPEKVRWYAQFVLKPMTAKYFEWPVDLVQCKTVSGLYMLYYAFPQRAFLDYRPIRTLLYQKKDSKVLDWRNPEICNICRSFLTAMDLLEQSGYTYNDFDMDRIVYQQTTGQVLFRHTLQLRRKNGTATMDKVDPGAVATEFAPPYLYKEGFNGYLPKADLYSIAALLFRLMIGRLPYEGRGLSNYGDVLDPVRDRDLTNHNNYFQHYHTYPHFIFSEKDESNRLAPMQENDLPRERWEMLPETLKQMFRTALDSRTAENQKAEGLYTAAQWLEACNKYCWDTEEYRR